MIDIRVGDCREILRTLQAGSVQSCITSPAYWGLRDYGVAGQLGMEKTPEEYVANLVGVFADVRRVLRDDGTLWLNIGDSFASGGTMGSVSDKSGLNHGAGTKDGQKSNHAFGRSPTPDGLKPKDLVMIPFRVALALQADGWWVRQTIVWSKPNCLSGGAMVYVRCQKGDMPMTVKDLVRLDPATVKLWNGEKWIQVVSWQENKEPQNPVEIEMRSGERIGCTADHLWPTQRGNVAACDLQVGDVIQTTRLPQPSEPNDPRLIPTSLGWFIGMYLAEGSRSGDCIQIASHIKESDRFRRLEAIVGDYGGICKVYHTGGNSAAVHIFSKVLSAILDTYLSGHTAIDKHLSNACWQRDNNFLAEILEGYLEGDGHYEEENRRWRLGFTRNYNLEKDMRTLCARLGIKLTLKLSVVKNKDGKEYKAFRGEIRSSRNGHHNEKEAGEVVAIRGSKARKFWDISVAEEPHLFALASGVLTHNCMPESVTDRPTTSHEYIFLLAKSERYFYDAEAVREPLTQASIDRISQATFDSQTGGPKDPRNGGSGSRNRSARQGLENLKEAHERGQGRNKRSVWTINTEPYKGAHFATFPTALVEPMIKAGTSERGCCPACGAGWVRVVEKSSVKPKDYNGKWLNADPQSAGRRMLANMRARREAGMDHDNPFPTPVTVGWRPSCNCPAHEPIPCTVLDPFFGAGTVGLVADRLGRDCIGIELNPKYVRLAEKRIKDEAPLFARVETSRQDAGGATPAPRARGRRGGQKPDESLNSPAESLTFTAKCGIVKT